MRYLELMEAPRPINRLASRRGRSSNQPWLLFVHLTLASVDSELKYSETCSIVQIATVTIGFLPLKHGG